MSLKKKLKKENHLEKKCKDHLVTEDLEGKKQKQINLIDFKKEKIVIKHIDVGGGLGIKYSETDSVPDIMEYGRIIERVLGDLGCKIIFEPGRYIVGNAGLLVTKVIYKKSGEKKDFVILDCAMNDFFRPALYGANHRIIPLKKKIDKIYF